MDQAAGCIMLLPLFILGAFADMCYGAAKKLRGGEWCDNGCGRMAHMTGERGEWWRCRRCGCKFARVTRFDDVSWEV
jgi:hypothetical protein